MGLSDQRRWFETMMASLVTSVPAGVFVHRHSLPLSSIQQEWTCGLVKIDQTGLVSSGVLWVDVKALVTIDHFAAGQSCIMYS